MSPTFDIDPITLDLIENSLKNIRIEMDEVLRRSAMSSSIREQHDEFPMIANAAGQMIVGQFGSYIPDVVSRFEGEIDPGDAIILNDPYLCRGSISHTNDLLVIIPIFHADVLVGYASQFGHVLDIGGRAAGTQSADALSIWDEGLRIPPVKLVERGRLNEAVLTLILNNTRVPDIVRSDIMGLVGACQRAGSRVIELCDRYGRGTYEVACDALLDRTRVAMTKLIRRYIGEEKVTFWDWVDDDGLGNGPFKLQLTVWREGDKAYFDWTGTDPQAPGSINFLIHENLCKLFFGVYMIMAFDSTILFNDGYNEVFEVVLPEGSLLNPEFPAPLSNRLNVHTRLFDCISGALGQKAPDLSMAAGYGTSPYLVYSGVDGSGEYFQMTELLFGGLPGRRAGDGLDGHSWWPEFRSTPAEYMETNYPLVALRYEPVLDSGGAGLHRGGTGIEREYLFRRAGQITVNDDRATLQPWGIGGGRAGGSSAKTLIRADGSVESLVSKIDNVAVGPGDRLVFRTAGAGGWGDPLERPVEAVERDIARRLVSAEAARTQYGVVPGDEQATTGLRQELGAERPALGFDFGDLPSGLTPPVAWTEEVQA
ncbi:hydantoinase B/oxoprolinase family protein [Spirillospora sp. NPDC047279]|uniref:hydantoinase B/oxoprolinase family protein n=1 Tax=Spirillospora sp. NPDC047279 TaxID=3155478 RepID=UPI0033D5E01B